MYLGAAVAVRMPDGSMRSFSGISTDLQDAILANGQPLRPDGTPYRTEQFMGGWLFDGCPLNVIFGNGWIAGQKEALIAAGRLPQCPQVGPTTEGFGPAPTGPPAINFSQTAAPGFTAQTRASSGAAILPTGVATPSAPIVITLPGGQIYQEPAQPAAGTGGEAEDMIGKYLPWALAAAAALYFFSGGKR